MIRLFAALLIFLPSAALAQMWPQPSAENPRIQSIQWAPGQEVILTALPKTGLTVMLEPGEQVRRVSLEDQSALDIRVSAERDSILILPLKEQSASGMLVQTDRRDYQFSVRTGTGLTAAYLVKFEFAEAIPEPFQSQPETSANHWRYSMRGDQSVRPAEISDDGVRTRIVFGKEQALAAVFAIGPTGKEEVVNGYMRDDVFVIDRVHEELVFRIDKDKATARRNRSPENADG